MEIFGEIALWTSALINLPAALFIGWGMAEGYVINRHFIFKMALLIMMAGLMGQFARSYIALSTGFAPTDAEIPFWVLKDMGISMLGIYYLLKSTKRITDEC